MLDGIRCHVCPNHDQPTNVVKHLISPGWSGLRHHDVGTFSGSSCTCTKAASSPASILWCQRCPRNPPRRDQPSSSGPPSGHLQSLASLMWDCCVWGGGVNTPGVSMEAGGKHTSFTLRLHGSPKAALLPHYELNF